MLTVKTIMLNHLATIEMKRTTIAITLPQQFGLSNNDATVLPAYSQIQQLLTGR